MTDTGRRCGWSRVEITEDSTEDGPLLFFDEDPIDEDPDVGDESGEDDSPRRPPPPHLRGPSWPHPQQTSISAHHPRTDHAS
jgi:hypothetical protein